MYVLSVNFTQNKNYTVSCNTCNLTTTTATTNTTPVPSTATPASTPTSTTPMPSTATPASTPTSTTPAFTPTSTTPVPSTATPASTPTSTTPVPSTATPASTPTTATPASTPTTTTPVPSTATPASTPKSTTPMPSTATPASTPTSTTPAFTPTSTTPVPSTATPASTPTSTTPVPSTATPASTPTSTTPVPSTATPASTPKSTTPMPSTATPASTPTSTTPVPSTATPASTPTSTTPVPSTATPASTPTTATPASTPTSTTPVPSTATPASTPKSTTPMPSTATPASTPTSTTPVPSTATPASTPTSTTPVPSTATPASTPTTATPASTPTSTTPVPSTATPASTPKSTTPMPSTATPASTPTSTTPVPSTATLASTAPTCHCNFTEDLNMFPKMIQAAEKNCGSDIKSKCGVSLKLKSSLMKLLDDDEGFNESIKIIDTDVMKGLVVKSNTSDLKDMLFDFSAQGVYETSRPTNNFTGSIKISVEALRKNSTGTNVKVAVVSFAPIYFQDNNILISSAEVIGIEKQSPVSNLTDPVTISFPYNSQNNSTLRCVFRDRKDGKDFWSETGVETVYEENKISCRSYHLSFFAVLVSPGNITISAEALKSLTYISYIGCGISFFFLCVVLFMHCMLRKAKSNNTTSVLINLCAALALLNLTFLLNEWLANMNNKGLCSFIGGTMHYALLSTFTWFGIEAFHLYLLMIKVFNIEIKHYLKKLAVVGWGLPSLVVMVIGSLGKYGKYSISTKDGKSVYMCWLMDPVAQYITIIGYYAVLFVFNLMIFAAVAVRIIRLTKAGPDSQKGTVKKNACILLGLCCLLGITWGVMFFSFGPLQEPSFYIFCILNSLQGVFLFVWYYNSSQIPKPLDPISQKPDNTSSNTSTDTGRPC
ncbi:adhesion G protein-coupled receptor G3-like [Acipenser ruthenus]|uniref:adhesion G protein-coupled receptor G3-like n=1 Tax=Acipenser ruthenus TaxID=7906 RepID=UPI002740AAF0|nr:adhesion G protein-coupled receptor G3-like [Acipenser ruthenus]